MENISSVEYEFIQDDNKKKPLEVIITFNPKRENYFVVKDKKYKSINKIVTTLSKTTI